MSYVYITNGANYYDSNTVSMYSMDSTTGMLTPLSPSTVSTGLLPLFISTININFNNSYYAYVTNYSSNTVSMYSINSTNGILTPLSPSTVSTDSNPLFIETLNINNSYYAYVTNNGSNTVSMYSINSTNGILTPLSTQTIATGTNPSYISIININSSYYVYVGNAGSNSIRQYSINSATGILTIVQTTNMTANTDVNPYYIITQLSSDGTYCLYAARQGQSRTVFYEINSSNGNLIIPSLWDSSNYNTALSLVNGMTSVSNLFLSLVENNGQNIYQIQLNAKGTFGTATNIILTNTTGSGCITSISFNGNYLYYIGWTRYRTGLQYCIVNSSGSVVQSSTNATTVAPSYASSFITVLKITSKLYSSQSVDLSLLSGSNNINFLASSTSYPTFFNFFNGAYNNATTSNGSSVNSYCYLPFNSTYRLLIQWGYIVAADASTNTTHTYQIGYYNDSNNLTNPTLIASKFSTPVVPVAVFSNSNIGFSIDSAYGDGSAKRAIFWVAIGTAF